MTGRQFSLANHDETVPVSGGEGWTGVCVASEDHAALPASANGLIDMRECRDGNLSCGCNSPRETPCS